MKKKFIITSVLFALLMTGCNQTPAAPVDEGPSTPEEPSTGYNEYTVDFEHFDLGSNTLLQSSDSTFNSKVLSYFQTQTELVTNFETDNTHNYVRIKKDEFDGGYGTAQGLIIGSQENDCYVTLTFSKELAYVKIKAQQYFNIHTYHDNENNLDYLNPNYDGQEYIEDDSEYGFHYEGHFSFIVNEEIWIGPGEGYEYDENWNPVVKIPEIVTKKFDINSSSLTIEGFKSERARIYEITLGFSL